MQGRDRPATVSERRIIYGFLILLIVFILSGCTAIGHKAPPNDWPQLQVSIHKVGFWELQTICGGGGLMVLAFQYFGCAWIYFNDMTCKVYYAADDESGQSVIEHELEHCRGMDHMGSSMLADGWEQWKRENLK